MESTSHRSYAVYDDSDQRPVLGWERTDLSEDEYIPLVPSGEGKLVSAKQFGEYTIKTVEPDFETRKILHG